MFNTITQAKKLFDFIDYHNKNLTKKQFYLIEDLKEVIKLDSYWNAEKYKILFDFGYTSEDVDLIIEREKVCKFECENETITIQEARELLGVYEYLSGLSRACFHWSAERENKGFKVSFSFNN